MMKIAFVYPESDYPRSPETGSKRMVDLFPSSIAISDRHCDYERLRDEGYHIFCYGHKPSLYENRKLSKGCLNDIVNSRSEYIHSAIGIRCISGFSYWKRHHDLYDCFFPTITNFSVRRATDAPCIGYYSREIRPDTNIEFVKFTDKVPDEIPILIMGIPLISIKRKYEYTTDENYFFSRVSHYFYMRSAYHDDPWPHTLFQACQAGCSIIMPIFERLWKDGVDDVLDICDVIPIDSYKERFPWEIDRPCSYAPSGNDFLPLYEKISETWNWVPQCKRMSQLL